MRWILRVVIGLVVLALVGLTALVLMPSDQIAQTLARRVEAESGNRVEIGEVRATLWPAPSVLLSQVVLSSEASTKPLLEAAEIRVAVDPEAFWGGEVRVRSVEMVNPVIRLHRNEDGRPNWDFARARAETDGGTGGTPDAGAGASDLLFEEGTIRNGIVTFEDETTGRPGWSASGIDMTVRRDGADGAVVAADLEVAGAPVALDARIASVAAALGGRIGEVSFTATSGGSTAAFDGRAGFAPLAAEGRIEASLQAPAALFRQLGLSMPDLPRGFGRETLGVAGDLTLTAERSLHLRDARLTADGNVFAGALDLVQGAERPKLTADLAAEALAFDPAEPSAGGRSAEPGGGQRGWPTERIDVSALGVADADLRLRANSVTAGAAVFSPVALSVTLDRARAVVDVSRLGAFDGTLAGTFVVNGRGGLSVRADMAATGVALAPFLEATLGYDRLSGTGSLDLNVLGVGNSVAEIAQSLEGEGSFDLNSGVLAGVDLPGMLRFLDAERVGDETETRYDRVTGTFGIAGGVLGNDDLRIEAPLFSADGAGVVGIGERVIDYGIVPVALPDADGTGGTRVPLRITGRWEDPKFRLDVEAAARARIDAEEEKLRAEAEARLAEELGVEAADGESLEDAARRRLEEELFEGLGDLLGGD